MSSQTIRPWLIRTLRAPAVLYDWNRDWLLDRRFLWLTHSGRRSGRCYRMTLEVIGDDRARHEVFVMVGVGRRAQWYRNVIAGGAVELAIGGERFRPDYREDAPAEAAAVLDGYERRNRLLAPIVRAVLSRLGWLALRWQPAGARASCQCAPDPCLPTGVVNSGDSWLSPPSEPVCRLPLLPAAQSKEQPGKGL